MTARSTRRRALLCGRSLRSWDLSGGDGTFGKRSDASSLLSESLEPVRQLRAAFPLVRELCDEQREWLGVPGDP